MHVCTSGLEQFVPNDLFVKQSVSFKNHYSFVPTTCVAKSDAIPVSYGYNCCGSLWYSFFNAPLATYSQDNLRATLFWNVYLQRVLIRSGSTNHDSSMNAFQVSYITEITGVKCCYFLVTYWFFFFLFTRKFIHQKYYCCLVKHRGYCLRKTMHSRAIQFLFDPQPVAMMCGGVKEGDHMWS